MADLKLKTAIESVGTLNSEGPLMHAPTFNAKPHSETAEAYEAAAEARGYARCRAEMLAKVPQLDLDDQEAIWLAINASVRPLPNGAGGFECEHCRLTFDFQHPRTDCAVSEARDIFADLLNKLALAHAETPED